MTGVWVLAGTLVAALLAGGLLLARDGRIRPGRTAYPSAPSVPPADTTEPTPAGPASAHAVGTSPTLPGPVADVLDPDAVTLVQISTTFCAPCRHARAVLTTLAETTDGVRHVELDVTDRPHVAQRLGVSRTPTTVAFAPSGRELLRVSGVPRLANLRSALRPHLLPRNEPVPQNEHGSRSEAD